MEWDEDGLDDGPVPPLLPPEDRLWRHPSEVVGHPPPRFLAPPRPGHEPRLTTIVALTSTISVLLTLGVVAVVRPIRTKVAVEQVATPVTPSGTITGLADVAAIAERLRPSIMRVQAEGPDGRKWGSGVLYRSDGMMLTSHHVVNGASSLRVSLEDGQEVVAKLIGTDADTDIAVLDLEGERFPVAPLGSATALRAGQPAITIGMPGASAGGPVVSVGVVSATGQAVDLRGMHLLDMIQTDAAVASGCAGGAVVDAGGVVIGIATTSVAGADGGTSGYATPIDVARIVAAQLLMHGHVTRGWLGVEGDDLPRGRAKDMGLSGGVVVKTVKEQSPAVSAGITPTDVIASIDGEPVKSMVELVVNLRTHRPGDTVSLAVVRGAERKTLKVTLAERP